MFKKYSGSYLNSKSNQSIFGKKIIYFLYLNLFEKKQKNNQFYSTTSFLFFFLKFSFEQFRLGN